MEEEKKEIVVDDETALDKELEETITTIKAGQESPVSPEVKPEEKVEPKAEESSTPPVAEAKEPEHELRLPKSGNKKDKFESDEVYEKRVELMDLVERKKLARTDAQKQQISAQIQTTRNELNVLGRTTGIINPLNQVAADAEKKPEEDEAMKADKERLKQLGGATKEDIEEIVRKERLAGEVKSTLDRFVDRHPELKDEDTREVFFDFVDFNYNWQNKGGKELMTVLELARENMFKPSESIQDRVLKGANVQEKVNAMQFPGGTVAKSDYSPEMRKSIDELKATGMSEEKAVELLTE